MEVLVQRQAEFGRYVDNPDKRLSDIVTPRWMCSLQGC